MKTLSLLFILWICVALSGCGKRREKSDGFSFDQPATKYTLLIVADIDVVKSDPRSYELVVRAIDKYFHDRIGESDQVIISQISGNDHPMIFQGTVRQLRHDIPNQEAFKRYLMEHSDPGRRLSEGLAESFEYLMNTYSVAKGNSIPVALIISSLKEGEAETPTSEQHFIDELIKFHRSRGRMAFYYCDQQRMAWIRAQTAKAGMTWVTLEGESNKYPPLPTFD